MKKAKNIVSIFIPVMIILFCFIGFLFASNSPDQTNITSKFLSGSMKYPFGTDELGRCVFSRILYGGKSTIGIVLSGSVIVMILGTILGFLLGFSASGKNVFWDSLLNAVTAIPPIAYLIIFIGIWGNSISTMMVALTASLILRMIKLVKTQTELELGKAYIMCAISSGASKLRLMMVHVFPNIIGELIGFICLSCADMILNISGFSFIGLSLGDDIIDWGKMLSEARGVSGMRPALLFYPILFIFLCTVSFNLLGQQIKIGSEANA